MFVARTTQDDLDRPELSVVDHRNSPGLRKRLVFLDGFAVAVAWILVHASIPAGSDWRPAGVLGSAATATAATLVLLHWQQLYQARACAVRLVELAGLTRVTIGSGAVMFLVPGPAAGRWGFACLGAVLSLAFLSGGRAFFDAWIRAACGNGRFVRSVALLGEGPDAERVLELLQNHPDLGYRVSGLVGERNTARRLGLDWLGDVTHAVSAIHDSGAGGVLIAEPDMDSERLSALISDLMAEGVDIQVSTGLWRVDQRRLRAAPLGDVPFFYVEPSSLSTAQLRLKRTIDVIAGAVVLMVAAPVMLLTALAVKLGDGGPIFFRQVRVGRDGAPFRVFKFRTMHTGSELQLADLADSNERIGPLFKMQADPRVTPVGRFLRAASLDELPQLFNVLAGSMSMVGPRPALPEEVARFDADLLARHRVPRVSPACGRSRPGTTRPSSPTGTSTCSTWRTGPALSTSSS